MLKLRGRRSNLLVSPVRENPEIVAGSVALEITRGYYAIVDEEDYDRLKVFNWISNNSCGIYVRAYRWNPGHKTVVYLHQEVMGRAPLGLEIDHINRDPLDCRKVNLRYVTHAINMQNSKNAGKGLGVCYSRQHRGWIGYVDRLGFKRKYCKGSYPSKEAAIQAVEELRLVLEG